MRQLSRFAMGGAHIAGRITAASIATALVLLVASNASAATVYTYTGSEFTTAPSPFTTSDSISGSFTVSNPLGGLFNGSVSPSSYSFSDVVDTLTGSNSFIGNLTIQTDAQGNIDGWVVVLIGFSGGEICANSTSDGSCLPGEQDIGKSDSGISAYTATQGAWAPTTTPLPAALPLFASGLGALGLLGWRRKRKALAA